jgi:hypothetical protein
MSNKTLTFDENANGWTSFFSYIPEMMGSMNNDMYSFKDGQLYLHNVQDGPRNTFYGVSYPTEIEFISNEAPDTIKSFKTIEIEGFPKTWDVTMATDTDNGHIDKNSFQTKEGLHYAYIRRNSEDEVNTDLLSVQGVGEMSSYSSNTLTFNSVPSNVSIGDKLYALVGGAPTAIGTISSKTLTAITVTSASITPTNGVFIFVAKNPVAESYGLKGYYANVRLSNSDTTPVEIFAVSSEVSKSFP